MATITFDTLAAANRLKCQVFNENKAEAIAEEMRQSHEINLEHLVTKSDLRGA